MKPDNIAGAVAARWLALTPGDARDERASWRRATRCASTINGHIRERLACEGRIHGSAIFEAERLVSKGYTGR